MLDLFFVHTIINNSIDSLHFFQKINFTIPRRNARSISYVKFKHRFSMTNLDLCAPIIKKYNNIYKVMNLDIFSNLLRTFKNKIKKCLIQIADLNCNTFLMQYFNVGINLVLLFFFLFIVN